MLREIYNRTLIGSVLITMISVYSLLINIGLKSFPVKTLMLISQKFAHDFVANSLIFLILTSILYIVFFVKRHLDKKRKPASKKQWPLIISFSFASLLIFDTLIHLNLSILPSIRSPLTITINSLFLVLIPVISLFVIFLGNRLSHRMKRVIKPVNSVILALSLIAVFLGYIIPYIHNNSTKFEIQNPPNVLIITIDALRRDHVSYYGYRFAETRNLDKFATESKVFTQGYSPNPWTIPSMYSMITSHYPSVHGADEYHRGSDKLTTLAQILKNYGYETDAYIANSIMDRTIGFDKGFDRYILYADIPQLLWIKHSTFYSFVARITSEKSYITPPPDTTAWLTDALTDELEKERKQPFFIWAHYLDPHAPLTPPKEYYKEYKAIHPEAERISKTGCNFGSPTTGALLYAAEIEYVDDSLGTIFEVLENGGYYDNTIVIITSDHGEEFYEHGKYGHARTHYDEVMAIPLLIRIPDGRHEVCTTPVTLLDIMPTIINYINAEAPSNLNGRDILNLENDEDDYLENPVFFDQTKPNRHMKSLYEYPFTITRTGTDKYDYRLVDIRVGVGPNDVVTDPDPELLSEYSNKLDKWAKKTAEEAAEIGGTSEVDINAIRRARLEHLGYF